MKRPVTLAIIFIIGCATGGVASQLAVPPVRAGTNPTRWEYSCVASQTGKINEGLNQMGAQGWELVSGFVTRFEGVSGGGLNNQGADSYAFCFKRALP
ncbi:MAG TPA: hypothetical protein VIV40_00890 [Kofleriaceae bacterium]